MKSGAGGLRDFDLARWAARARYHVGEPWQLVQIGVLSERGGDWARAREYFERYLANYPTNVRAFTIRQKLEAVNRRLAQEGGA